MGPVTDAFFQFEDELRLLEREVAGVRIWERIRFLVHKRILEGAGVLAADRLHERLSPWSRIASTGRLALRAVTNAPWTLPTVEYLFIGSGRRLRTGSEDWIDPYCDPIVRELGPRALLAEFPFQFGHARPASTRHLKYLDWITALTMAAAKLSLGPRLSVDDRNWIAMIESRVRSEFGIDVPIAAAVEQVLASRALLRPAYDKLLAQVRPRAVVLVCSYGKEELIEACRRRGVPVVELQHGVISRYHVGYSYPRQPKSAFPDHFFAFGRYWAETVDLPISPTRVHEVGYPFLEEQRMRHVQRSADHILFISQVSIGRELSRWAVRLQQDSAGRTKIIYKLHPREVAGWRERYPWLAESGIEVAGSGASMYRLFAGAAAQVGVYSTALFEGLAYGLPTFLVNLPGIEYMDHLIRGGHARVACNHGELREGLEQSDAWPRVDMDTFFRSDSVTNALQALERIALGMTLE